MYAASGRGLPLPLVSRLSTHMDEVILSHTNENEYNSFVNNKKNEALKDRMILVKVTDL